MHFLKYIVLYSWDPNPRLVRCSNGVNIFDSQMFDFYKSVQACLKIIGHMTKTGLKILNPLTIDCYNNLNQNTKSPEFEWLCIFRCPVSGSPLYLQSILSCNSKFKEDKK